MKHNWLTGHFWTLLDIYESVLKVIWPSSLKLEGSFFNMQKIVTTALPAQLVGEMLLYYCDFKQMELNTGLQYILCAVLSVTGL